MSHLRKPFAPLVSQAGYKSGNETVSIEAVIYKAVMVRT